MYTDPSLSLYRALGLTRQTGDAGPDDEAGDYLVQSALEATMSTIKRATQMPLRNPGAFLQLGGEFIFEGPQDCTFAHRMTNTRSHAPIRDVCADAGVRLQWIHYEPGDRPPAYHRASFSNTLDLSLGSEEGIMSASPTEDARSDNGEDEDAETAGHATPKMMISPKLGSLQTRPEMKWQDDRNEVIDKMRRLKQARRAGAWFSVDDKREVHVVGEDGEERELTSEFGVLNL